MLIYVPLSAWVEDLFHLCAKTDLFKGMRNCIVATLQTATWRESLRFKADWAIRSVNLQTHNQIRFDVKTEVAYV